MSLLVNIFLLAVTCVCVFGDSQLNQQYFLEDNNETYVIVTWMANKEEMFASCEIFRGRDFVDYALNNTDVTPVQVSRAEMLKIVSDCRELRKKRQVEEVDEQNATARESTAQIASTEPTSTGGIIFPGTKWCGNGNVAENYDDLGTDQDTDRCCRAHDLCNDTMAPGETKYDLTNTSPFTSLSCECDHDFHTCLNRVNSGTSNAVGNMYFNILRKNCYGPDYPLSMKCKIFLPFFTSVCIVYERDINAPKVYQWISAEPYMKIPLMEG